MSEQSTIEALAGALLARPFDEPPAMAVEAVWAINNLPNDPVWAVVKERCIAALPDMRQMTLNVLFSGDAETPLGPLASSGA